MSSDAALATKPPARAKAREPVEPTREPDRIAARPGALTYTHPLTGEVLVRDKVQTSDSPYHIPKELVPEGMVYQWRRESTAGEPDVPNILALKRNGWREVPADRHPDRPMRIEGLILMECPEVFVRQSEKEDRERAMSEKRKQLRPKNEATRPGYFDDEVVSRQANFGARRGAPEKSDPSLRPTYSRSVDIDS